MSSGAKVRDDPDLHWFDIFLVVLNYILIGIVRYLGEIYDRAMGRDIVTKEV